MRPKQVQGLLVLALASIVVQDLASQESQANLFKNAAKPLGRYIKGALKKYSYRENDEKEDQSRSKRMDTTKVMPTDDFDFQAKCFSQRGPKFVKPPVVHFFPFQRHSRVTRECGKNFAIELKPIDGEMSLTPHFDEVQIQARLIDSGLFDPSVHTYILTHGFKASWNGSSWLCDLKDFILDSSRANVFILDWSGGSKPPRPFTYGTAVGNSQYVGAAMGEFIRLLVDKSGQKNAGQYHVIGHSLGAHVSGYAGYYLNVTLGRITGLDPAGPCFNAHSETIDTAIADGYLGDGSRRLSRQSAQTVLVLHTDASLLGLKQSCGHFDVYINGGYQQPECLRPSIPWTDHDSQGKSSVRLLIRTKSKALSDNLRCRHAFCYEIFKHFVHFGKLPWDEAVASMGAEESDKKCYMVAYQCRDWNSFKAGECGFCRDGDHECVLISPSVGSINQTALVDKSNYLVHNSESSPVIDDDDDERFNDESIDDPLDELHGRRQKKIDECSRGRHFIRSGIVPTICSYHYQIVVAVRERASQSETSDKRLYYLDIPLELSGRLTDERGNRLGHRLVQVSHKITPDSVAFNNIRSSYMMSAKLTVRDLVDGAELNFYTALITFEPIIDANRCGPDDVTNGARGEKEWQICQPPDNIQEAHLWSSSKLGLKAVAWVAMNYMSGLHYEQRLGLSYVFNRNTEEPMIKDDVKRVEPAVETEPNLNSSKEVASGNGFLSSVPNPCTSKFKCNRIRKELVYAINLRPAKPSSQA